MELLVFGADSLVGSHFVATTGHTVVASGRRDPRPELPSVRRFRPAELGRPEDLTEAVRSSGAGAVLNFAAATEVDRAERERPAAGAEPGGEVYEVNAVAPGAIAAACAERQLPFFQLSTDFVFDGSAGPYPEEALPAPLSPAVSWYGWTKGEGERRVREAHPEAVILRIAYPFRARYDRKMDFARSLLARRRAGSLPPLFTDQVFSPTWVPDVSRALEHLLERRSRGTYHVASPETTTPYEFARALLGELEGSPPTLSTGSMAEFLRRPGATPRPRRGGLRVERLPAEGVLPRRWREAVGEFVAEVRAG